MQKNGKGSGWLRWSTLAQVAQVAQVVQMGSAILIDKQKSRPTFVKRLSSP